MKAAAAAVIAMAAQKGKEKEEKEGGREGGRERPRVGLRGRETTVSLVLPLPCLQPASTPISFAQSVRQICRDKERGRKRSRQVVGVTTMPPTPKDTQLQ